MTMLSGILRNLFALKHVAIFGVDPNYPRCLERQTQLFGNTNPTIMGAMKSDTGTESGKQYKDG